MRRSVRVLLVFGAVWLFACDEEEEERCTEIQMTAPTSGDVLIPHCSGVAPLQIVPNLDGVRADRDGSSFRLVTEPWSSTTHAIRIFTNNYRPGPDTVSLIVHPVRDPQIVSNTFTLKIDFVQPPLTAVPVLVDVDSQLDKSLPIDSATPIYVYDQLSVRADVRGALPEEVTFSWRTVSDGDVLVHRSLDRPFAFGVDANCSADLVLAQRCARFQPLKPGLFGFELTAASNLGNRQDIKAVSFQVLPTPFVTTPEVTQLGEPSVFEAVENWNGKEVVGWRWRIHEVGPSERHPWRAETQRAEFSDRVITVTATPNLGVSLELQFVEGSEAFERGFLLTQ